MIEHAKLENYGYKDRTVIRKIWKIISYILVAITLFAIYASTLMIALQSFNSSSNTQVFGGFTVKWYTQMFTERALREAIGNTLLVSVIAVFLATILGTLIALGIFSLAKKHKQLMVLLNNIPLLNADMVTGISLMLVFSIFLKVFPYLFGPFSMIIAHLFFTLPYVILSVLPKLKDIDKNLIDAALDLGIKPYRAILKVIVPAISSAIFAGALLAFTVSVDDFVISYYTTGNGFDNLSIWIYSSIGRRSLTPSVYAFSTLLLIVTLLMIISSRLLKHKGKRKK
jgi:spermidine/putrescine transport system permease protein